MFFGEDRHAAMVRVILADEDAELDAALAELLPLQQGDFEGIFAAMEGPPVQQVEADVVEGRADQRLLDRVRALQETNPMLGTRGVRLGILYPKIYAMQCRAIFRAAKAVHARGHDPSKVEIMIPLIDYERELELVRGLVERVGDEEGVERGSDLVGTMIELPRACTLADHIAHFADFFSFGTNDLTQTTLGFSRDDIEGRILARYI